MKPLIILFVVLLLLGGGAWYYLNTVHNPQKGMLSEKEKQQALTKLLDRKPVLEEKKPTDWKTFNGIYIHLAYPSDANIYHNTKTPVMLESFSWGIMQPHIITTASVMQANGVGSINDYSGVMFRKSQSELYKEETTTIVSHQGVLFSKNAQDGVEKAAFFLVNDKVVSIVVSGYNSEDVNDYYNKVVTSMSF